MNPVTPQMPSGACDCHTHVVGDAMRYPMVQERHYTPGPAPHQALIEHMQRTGMQRAVIVQPSFYGTDNRCMVDSLIKLHGAGRGIAVVDERIDAASLDHLHEVGVRGLRVNIESAGVRDAAAAEEPLRYWARRIARQGWHLQIYASHTTIAELAPMLATLEVPVVLDHFAMVPATLASGDRQIQKIHALVATGNAYIKLSAAYRIAQADPVAQATPLAQSFLQTHPERVLWGSDWPHTNREPGKGAHEVSRYREVSATDLRRSIETWLPTQSLRQQVLVENPARLYDFC